MNRFDHRMLDRDLEEALGHDVPPDLRGRILAARHSPRRRSARLRPLPAPAGRRSRQTALFAAAAISLSVIAALVVLWSYVATRPAAPAPGLAGGANTPAGVSPALPQPAPRVAEPQPQPEAQAPQSQPAPRPQKPETLPPSPPQPEPLPEPAPPGEPPRSPESEVERPAPPLPAPRETEPPPTEAPRPERRQVGAVLALPKGSRLQVRDSANESWREAETPELFAGTFLKISDPADLTLGDALVRFEGTLHLGWSEGAVCIDFIERKTRAWCDNLGGRTPLRLGLRQLWAQMDDGVACVEAGSASLEIACIEGTIQAGGATLEAGRFAALSARGLSKPRELTAAERQPRLIAGMAPRRLLREEFTEEPAGKLYGGALKDGLVRVEGPGALLAFDISPALIAVKGAKLRLRYRVTDCSSIYVQFLGEDVRRQFGSEFIQRKQGPWLELEIRLDSLPFDAAGAGGEKMPTGLKLGKFQCYLRGEKNCTLEIDWLEVVRE